MKKGQVSNFLRHLILIYITDLVRFYIEKYKNGKVNRDFKRNNPEVALPPDYLIYESFRMDYEKYYTESQGTAKWLADYFRKYINLKDKKYLIGVLVQAGLSDICPKKSVMDVSTRVRIIIKNQSTGVQKIFLA